MVTRADVARLAGTSTAVVTYVVNNGPRPVAPETRERVRRAIEQLGYRPNVVARALKVGTTQTVGLIVPDNTNPFFAELAHAIEDVFFVAGYSLLLANSADSLDRERQHLRTLLDRQVDAVLLISLSGEPAIGEIVRADKRAIVLHRVPQDSLASSICIDDEQAAYDIATHLREAHGITDTAMITGPDASPVAVQRARGWSRAVSDTGADLRHAPFSRRGGYQAATALLTGNRRPGAIFAANDQQAIGVIRAAADLGVRVPEDVAVAGFDGTTEAGYTVPSLTTVVQPSQQIAEAAFEILRGAATDPPTCRVLPHRLELRDSCGKH
jgi:LacI family transcriptional regulator